jgi:hypothetical protein
MQAREVHCTWYAWARIVVPSCVVTVSTGVMTGRCLPYPGMNVSSCEAVAWCPVEIDTYASNNMTVIHGGSGFTVFVKSNIIFPLFNAAFTNVPPTVNLTTCMWDTGANYNCPIFRVSDILSQAGISSFESIAMKGAVVAMTVEWQCNLDQSSACSPTYSFTR